MTNLDNLISEAAELVKDYGAKFRQCYRGDCLCPNCETRARYIGPADRMILKLCEVLIIYREGIQAEIDRTDGNAVLKHAQKWAEEIAGRE